MLSETPDVHYGVDFESKVHYQNMTCIIGDNLKNIALSSY